MIGQVLKSCSLAIFLTPILAGADNSVFGIPLGSTFLIPECEKKQFGSTVIYSTPKTICYERINSKKETKPIENDSILIKFPISDTPSLISGNTLVGLVIDKKLEGIGFNTLGYSNQDIVLLKLTEKYGQPTTIIPKKVQNKFGTEYTTYTALWTLPDLYISFQSVNSSLLSGLVNIDTIKGKTWRDAKLKELLKDKRPL